MNKKLFEELFEELLADHSPAEKLPIKVSDLFQPIVIYNRKVNIHDSFFKHHLESVPFIFYSDMIFTTQKDAAEFLGIYIKKLIDEKDLPQDVLNSDHTVNEEFIKTAVVKLSIGQKTHDN